VIGGYTAPRQSRTEAGTLLMGYHHQGGALLCAGKLDTSSDQNLRRDLGARLPG
jgi:hypothetical protein